MAAEQKKVEKKWAVITTTTARATTHHQVDEAVIQQVLATLLGAKSSNQVSRIVLQSTTDADPDKTTMDRRIPYLQKLLLASGDDHKVVPLMKLCRLVQGRVQVLDWEKEKNRAEMDWNTMFAISEAAKEVKTHENLVRLYAELQTLLQDDSNSDTSDNKETGPAQILRKTPFQRWRLDLKSSRGHSVIYCMVVWDVVDVKWKLYVGQAATLNSRFYSKGKINMSHLAAIQFACKYHDSPNLLVDLGLQLVDVAAAAAVATATKPIYLFVLEATAPSQLNQREEYWMERLGVLNPDVGLNVQRPRKAAVVAVSRGRGRGRGRARGRGRGRRGRGQVKAP